MSSSRNETTASSSDWFSGAVVEFQMLDFRYVFALLLGRFER